MNYYLSGILTPLQSGIIAGMILGAITSGVVCFRWGRKERGIDRREDALTRIHRAGQLPRSERA